MKQLPFQDLQIHSGNQARIYVGVPPQGFLCPPYFVPRKVGVFDHLKKTKILISQNVFFPPHLKAWLRAWWQLAHII